MRRVNFPNCCGMKVLTDFQEVLKYSWTSPDTYNTCLDNAKEELKTYLKWWRPGKMTIMAVLNPNQYWASEFLEDAGFRLVGTNQNPNTQNILKTYIRDGDPIKVDKQ